MFEIALLVLLIPLSNVKEAVEVQCVVIAAPPITGSQLSGPNVIQGARYPARVEMLGADGQYHEMDPVPYRKHIDYCANRLGIAQPPTSQRPAER